MNLLPRYLRLLNLPTDLPTYLSTWLSPSVTVPVPVTVACASVIFAIHTVVLCICSVHPCLTSLCPGSLAEMVAEQRG